MVRLYQSGMKWNDIAAETGFSTFTVGNALRRAGVSASRGQVNTRTSPEVEARIIALYEQGVPWTNIVTQTGVTEHTISAAIRRNGGALGRKPVALADGLRERIPGLYAEGIDAPEIGRMLGCHSSSVYNVLKKQGIDRREQVACDNPAYFNEIDTPNKAYWLGFIGADGCVTGFSSGYPRLAIKLARKDRGHLVLLHGELKARRPIRDFDEMSLGVRRPCSCLTVNSPTVAESLVRLGVTPRKSATLQPWNGPHGLMPHYWRGLIDGDGSITVNDRGVYLSFVGSQGVVCAFTAWAAGICDTKATPRPGGNGKRYWVVQIGGTVRILMLLSALYDDAPTALARKKALSDLAVHGKPLAATLF